MPDLMSAELRDLVVPPEGAAAPDKPNGRAKNKPGRPSGAARRAETREAKAQLEAAVLQAQLANQAGLAMLLDTLHGVLGLPIPHEMSAALSGALLHAVEVTWPNLSPVAVAWGQVGVLAAGMYGPAIASKVLAPPAELPGEVGADG